MLQVWKLECAFLKDLVEHGKAVCVPKHAFDAISAFVFQHKKVPGQRVKMHGTANDAAQFIETLAHVGVLGTQKNSGLARSADQFATSLKTASISCNACLSIPANIRTTPVDRSISAIALVLSTWIVFGT